MIDLNHIKHPDHKAKNELSSSCETTLALPEKVRQRLRSECEDCMGLCCVALRFSALDGFPTDKKVGQPCLHLQEDYQCEIHDRLSRRGMKGCITFDCFGAGQKVTQNSFAGQDWRTSPELSQDMFTVFNTMMRLHELLWYLTEALTLQPARPIHDQLKNELEEIERLTYLEPKEILKLDLEKRRAAVNDLLLKTSELVRVNVNKDRNRNKDRKNRSGRKLNIGRGADLIGADLRKADVIGANLRGAYLIAANLKGNNLNGVYLTDRLMSFIKYHIIK